MRELLAAAGAHKVVTALVVAFVVIVGGIAVAAVDRPTMATVTKVVDGDTIDVRYDGEERRVRLLNIDTPESVDPNSPVECLGPEASEWLTQRLPVGTEVRLEHDQERHDRYERELAAIFLGEEFVNAEIARAGLGVAMSVAPNVKYLRQVEAAQAEAERGGRGLFAASAECTLPAQVERLIETATDTIAEDPSGTADVAEFDAHAGELAAALAMSRALLEILDGDRDRLPLVAYTGQVDELRHQVRTAKDRLESARASNGSARQARQDQLAEEARRAAEEAARLASEEAARLAAEEAARAAAAERAAAAARATQRASPQPPPSTATRTQAPPKPSGSSGPSTYTGCRSYAPGGKTWTPIPC